jgi:hypothetical protein
MICALFLLFITLAVSKPAGNFPQQNYLMGTETITINGKTDDIFLLFANTFR